MPCPPGFTRQWCEEHTPTPTEVQDDDNDNGGTGPTPTAVVGPPPPPPNSQLFSATVKFRGKPLNDSSTFWRMFESFPTVVQVVANPHANVNIDEYEFKLKVNPGDTGFYVVHNNDLHCSPTRPGDAETDWYQTHTFFPHLIRCGVGLVSNAGVELLARRGRHYRDRIQDPPDKERHTGLAQGGWHSDLYCRVHIARRRKAYLVGSG